jgi:hypothetical protein
MLKFIFQLEKLLDNLLSFLDGGSVGVVLVGAEYIVECLMLCFYISDSFRQGVMFAWGETNQDDRPAVSGGDVGEGVTIAGVVLC